MYIYTESRLQCHTIIMDTCYGKYFQYYLFVFFIHVSFIVFIESLLVVIVV